MFSSRTAVAWIDDVPSPWIFEHYLKLNNRLVGQNCMIKSIFNPMDNTPSMSIYLVKDTTQYKFFCHCTSMRGDGVDLVSHLFQLSRRDAVVKVMNDYREYLKGNIVTDIVIKPQEKWKVEGYKVRPWTKGDVDYWSPYNIGSKLLDFYNVKPLSEIVLIRGSERMEMIFKAYAYGYMTGTGELYKLYQPPKEQKFMIFKNHLQGWDQVKGKPRLFVCSSLKDIMSMRSLGIDGDYIAPQSENSGMEGIINWILDYPEKYIIFDNDQAGIRMMEKYHQTYGIPYLHLKMAKDISDSIKEFGASTVKQELETLLK